MTHGSLFSGIGGFDLAAEWMGWENKFHCEWNLFGQQVLKHYWPDAETFTDITKSEFTKYANRIDILTGGFPCQPYSTAGKRLGTEDDRHLWPEMLRAIREIKPRWVLGENVRGLISWNGGMVFDEVQTDLEAEGYEVLPFLLPACAVNAPHRRDRIWFVAYASGNGYQLRGFGEDKSPQRKGESIKEEWKWFWNDNRGVSESGITSNSKGNGNSRGLSEMEKENGGFWKPEKHRENDTRFGNISGEWIDPNSSNQRLQGRQFNGASNEKGQIGGQQPSGSAAQFYKISDWRDFPTQPPVCRGDDGLPTELLRQRIREDSMGVISEKEIDKIISKAATEHRTESIKAYGNAVVPQVVYQIFKVIQQYELNKLSL